MNSSILRDKKTGKFLSPFEKLRQEVKGGSSERSVRWYQDQIRTLGLSTISPAKVLSSTIGKFSSNIEIGQLHLFVYDAKGKDTLPYWDMFPLVLPFDLLDDGFIGLSLHYIPPLLRMQLLAKMLEYTNGKFDEKTRIKLKWNTLKQVSKFPGAVPCVKRYLYDHVASRFMKINAFDWKTAIMLPLQQFQKATTQSVYRHSVASI